MVSSALSVLVTVFAAPAFAVEQFYLAYDGKRCEVFSHKPPAGMKVLGTYNSQHDARKAMDKRIDARKGDWFAVASASVGALLVVASAFTMLWRRQWNLLSW